MKADINLLHQRKTKKHLGKNTAMTLIAVVFFAGALFAGITLPSGTLSNTKTAVANLDQQLVEYPALEAEMYARVDERNLLSNQLDGLKAIASAKSNVSEYIDIIESSLPNEAIITMISLEDDSLSLLGNSLGDAAIATFMLRLRESGVFRDLYVESSTVMTGFEEITIFKLTGKLPGNLEKLPGEEEDNAADVGENIAQPASEEAVS